MGSSGRIMVFWGERERKWETWMKQMGAVESIELKGEPEKVVSQYSSSLHFFFLTIAFAFRFRNDYYYYG